MAAVLLGQGLGVPVLKFLGGLDAVGAQGLREDDWLGLPSGVGHLYGAYAGDLAEGGAGQLAPDASGFDQGVVDIPEDEAWSGHVGGHSSIVVELDPLGRRFGMVGSVCDRGCVTSGHIGERIAAYRRRRGMSQAALAGLVGRSESWLSQVERGVRSVDRLSVLLDVSRVLRVEVEVLTGRAWQYAPNGSPMLDGLDGVRRFFSRYDALLGVDLGRTHDLVKVKSRVAAAHATYQSAGYEQLIGELPDLLADADVVRQSAEPADRREALLAYVSAYGVVAKLLTKMGAGDLALLAADRCATAAVETESLSARGMAAYQVVCALLTGSARPEDAEPLAVAMAERAQAGASGDEPELLSVAGALWLVAAVIAARRADRGEAWRRLDLAEGLAVTLGTDANFVYTAFGGTNVAIHRVSVAAELGDPAGAVRASSTIDPERLPPGLNSRRAQVHLDLAWAQAQRKKDSDAVLHLLEAEQTAPEAVRYNVVARELIRELLVRQRRMKTSTLHRLAVRAGVLD